MSSLVINAGEVGNGAGFDTMQNHIETLSCKMDKLINIQAKVLNRLDGMSQDIDDIEKDMEHLKVDKEEIHFPPRMVNQTQVMGREVREICREMSTIMSAVNQRSEQQAQKLEGMENLVLSMQRMISFIGETVKSSRVTELMFKHPAARRSTKMKDHMGKQAVKKKSSTDVIIKNLDKVKDYKSRNGKEKPSLSPKALKAQKKMKPLDTTDHISSKKHALLLEEVQKLNKENTEKSGHQLTTGCLDLEAGVSSKDEKPDTFTSNLVDYLREDSKVAIAENQKAAEEVITEGEDEAEEVVEDKEAEETVSEAVKKSKDVLKETLVTDLPTYSALEKEPEVPDLCDAKNKNKESAATGADQAKDGSISPVLAGKDKTEVTTTNVKPAVTEEKPVLERPLVEKEEEKEQEAKKTEDESTEKLESDGWAVFKADGVEFKFNLKQKMEEEKKENSTENDAEKEDEDDEPEHYFIDTAPPPSAPFNHRIVSTKPNQIRNFYTIYWQEVLGGGRFGQVHKCVENSSGLSMAAKVIKARSQKEKEVVKNEIQVMNNLDHANLIQLYAAYESRNDIILVLEYVGGGELFDRIIDENYTLMELDALVFIRQICDGLQHMHKMSILHLDLKPENILCVSRVTNKIKIIDFGLARVYKPREKLKVNFGTPEFLAPEIINYDFVSFNTDMWSLGVITYMLLSGLCPFLGDDDNETLNNILACQWNFEEQEFVDTSEEAKDFISRLLIVNRSWRMGACEALRHPWLSDSVLHHRLHTKKTMCRSRRSSCVPTTDS
ncbi:myosin light chain kinase 2, skeletal/cardiac muscle-like isoform X2 [Gouania willdenowi]|uniref:Myosin light chain kinase 2, skeletal/cardiac muscle-like n=1 Tax=Gouania willdenowi TaxID=441366 RepID=A0A8C5DTC6_GOUWI|nr:myosin light chain kinase 2, skeletal/cardiac muscle-like isoform X2 [Gouania willdenowi]